MRISEGRFSSPICNVKFAGFESNTLALQKNGWAVTMEEQPDFSRAGKLIRLYLKHEKARLHAVTNTWNFEYSFVYKMMENPDWTQFCTFEVIHVANDIRFHIIPVSSRGFGKFSAIDCMPQFERSEEKSITDIVPFRTISMEAPELVVDPAKVNEIFDMILKAQDPKQAEIREKRRRESWYENQEARIIPDAFDGYDARKDIRAQIISLAG